MFRGFRVFRVFGVFRGFRVLGFWGYGFIYCGGCICVKQGLHSNNGSEVRLRDVGIFVSLRIVTMAS